MTIREIFKSGFVDGTVLTIIGLALFVAGIVVVLVLTPLALAVEGLRQLRACTRRRRLDGRESTGPTINDLYESVMDWSFNAFGTHEELGPEDSLSNLRVYAQQLGKDPNDKHAYIEFFINLCDAMVRSKSGIEFDDITLHHYSQAIRSNAAVKNITGLPIMDVVDGTVEGATVFGIDDPVRVARIFTGVAEQLALATFTPEEILVGALAEVRDRAGL